MVKLVRLIQKTDQPDKTALFDNVFNDEISLRPFSEVGLHSLSVQTRDRSVTVVDNDNSKFTMNQLGRELNEDSQAVVLDTGTFNKTNYPDLLRDMYTSLNDSTDAGFDSSTETTIPGGPQVGQQWICQVGNNGIDIGNAGVVNMAYRSCTLANMPAVEWSQENVSETVVGNTKLYKRSGGTAGNADSYLVSGLPYTFGCGSYQLNLKKVAGNDGGVFIGLSEIDFATTGAAPTMAQCVIGIHAPKATDPYKTNLLAATAKASSTQNVADGDAIAFERLGDTIYPVRYSSTNVRTELVDDSGNGVVKQYPQYYAVGGTAPAPLYLVVIIFASAADAEVDQVRWNPDAFKAHSAGVPGLDIVPAGRGMYHQSINEVMFDMSTMFKLRRFLGYKEEKYPLVGTDLVIYRQYAFPAETLFSNVANTQGYYVELMSLQCEGYDGMTGSRKNVLATIPESDTDGKIVYNSQYPLMLDINNRNDISLRNIRLRLLQVDGSEVRTDGINSLTLVFSQGN